MKKQILVTGGAGYIGSHTVIALIEQGFSVVIIDNLSNSNPIALQRIEAIVGETIPFHKIDLLDYAALDTLFSTSSFDAVIHFAGLKAVGESVEKPLWYYRNNVMGSINLFELMLKHGVHDLVFSSSATVYGDPATVPITEDFPLSATNPYGRTKLMIEEILRDLHQAHPFLNIALLRYFNPVGAHPSGTIGEDPNGIPNNLFPFITQVAVGMRDKLRVFGGDYPTPDGTGVRDYIHVSDLADGHVKALHKLATSPGIDTYNLGTGKGYSVLEAVHAFEKASLTSVPFEIVDRRPGDIASCYANPDKAESELGWKAEKGMEEMCADAWRWQSMNPKGYTE